MQVFCAESFDSLDLGVLLGGGWVLFATNLKMAGPSKKCTRRQFGQNAHFLLLSAGFCGSGLDMPAGLICTQFLQFLQVMGDWHGGGTQTI